MNKCLHASKNVMCDKMALRTFQQGNENFKRLDLSRNRKSKAVQSEFACSKTSPNEDYAQHGGVRKTIA